MAQKLIPDRRTIFNFAYPKHLIILANLPKPDLERYLTPKGRNNEKLPQKTTCLAN